MQDARCLPLATAETVWTVPSCLCNSGAEWCRAFNGSQLIFQLNHHDQPMMKRFTLPSFLLLSLAAHALVGCRISPASPFGAPSAAHHERGRAQGAAALQPAGARADAVARLSEAVSRLDSLISKIGPEQQPAPSRQAPAADAATAGQAPAPEQQPGGAGAQSRPAAGSGQKRQALCAGTLGDWCRPYLKQGAGEAYRHPKPGGRQCANGCSGVGTCNYDIGICDCPAGGREVGRWGLRLGTPVAAGGAAGPWAAPRPCLGRQPAVPAPTCLPPPPPPPGRLHGGRLQQAVQAALHQQARAPAAAAAAAGKRLGAAGGPLTALPLVVRRRCCPLLERTRTRTCRPPCPELPPCQPAAAPCPRRWVEEGGAWPASHVAPDGRDLNWTAGGWSASRCAGALRRWTWGWGAGQRRAPSPVASPRPGARALLTRAALRPA
jgi:hypothetical protein